jgi:hypothetical protein
MAQEIEAQEKATRRQICAGSDGCVDSTEVSEPTLTKASATLRLILSVRLD